MGHLVVQHAPLGVQHLQVGVPLLELILLVKDLLLPRVVVARKILVWYRHSLLRVLLLHRRWVRVHASSVNVILRVLAHWTGLVVAP